MKTLAQLRTTGFVILVVVALGNLTEAQNDKPTLDNAPRIHIGTAHNAMGGFKAIVPIEKSGGEHVAAFAKLKIAFSEGTMSFDTVLLADTLRNLGWQYHYTVTKNADYGPLAASVTIVTILGLRPGAEAEAIPNGCLFNLRFRLANSREADGKFERIAFVWSGGCDDNSFLSANFDTSYVAAYVTRYNEWIGRDTSFTSTDERCLSGRVLSADGPCDECFHDSALVLRYPGVIFEGGGIDRVCCFYGLDVPGDINLNGIAYEIEDAQLLSQFLLFYPDVLDSSLQLTETKIEQSDSNQDGEKMTISDLIYLYRVIVGDALPFAKVAPYSSAAVIRQNDKIVSLRSPVEVSGLILRFQANDSVEFVNLSSLEMSWTRRGNSVLMLLCPPLDSLVARINSGDQAILQIKGKAKLVAAEVSDYNGNQMVVGHN